MAQTPRLARERQEVAAIRSFEQQANAYHGFIVTAGAEDLKAGLQEAETASQIAKGSKSPEEIAVAQEDIGFVQYLLGDNASGLNSWA